MNRFATFLLLSTLFCLSACRVGPSHCVPPVPIYEEWDAERFQTQGIELDHCEELLCMWDLFNDPLLSYYLRCLIYSNLDVRQAYAKVREAYAQRRIAAASLFPFLDARIDYHSSKPAGGILRPGDDMPAGGGMGGGGLPFAGIPLNVKQQSFLADVAAVWELDLFGKHRNEVDASTAFLQMQIENRNAIYLSLLAEFGRNYLELRKQQQLFDFLKSEVAILDERVQIGKERLENGLDPGQVYLEIESSQSTIKAELFTIEANILSLIYHLSVLIGQPPIALTEELGPPGNIPEMIDIIPVGVPSDLLRRRPDIRFAERQIAQTTANVGVAVADLFPKVVIDGSYGFQNLHLGNLRGQGESWSYGGNILTPIFHGGKLRANVERNQWIRKQAFLEYESTVLKSLEEAESAMVRLLKSKDSLQEKLTAYKKQKQQVDLTQELFDNGLASQFEWLDAQLKAIDAGRAWVSQEGDTAIQLIILYKALGGGW